MPPSRCPVRAAATCPVRVAQAAACLIRLCRAPARKAGWPWHTSSHACRACLPDAASLLPLTAGQDPLRRHIEPDARIASHQIRRIEMRGLIAAEMEQVGGGESREAPPPAPGVDPGVWNALLGRLEWERRNPYRREK